MRLDNFSIIIKPQINGVLLLLYYSCDIRLTQLRRLSFQFQLKPSLPHYAPLIRKYFPSLAPTYIPCILSQFSLTSKLLSSGPAEAAHVGSGAPFTPYYVYI